MENADQAVILITWVDRYCVIPTQATWLLWIAFGPVSSSRLPSRRLRHGLKKRQNWPGENPQFCCNWVHLALVGE